MIYMIAVFPRRQLGGMPSIGVELEARLSNLCCFGLDVIDDLHRLFCQRVSSRFARAHVHVRKLRARDQPRINRFPGRLIGSLADFSDIASFCDLLAKLLSPFIAVFRGPPYFGRHLRRSALGSCWHIRFTSFDGACAASYTHVAQTAQGANALLFCG